MMSINPLKIILNTVKSIVKQQTRNSFVVKRKYPFPLHKKGGYPTKMKGRHFVYDLVEDTTVRKLPDMQIILKKFIAGVGKEGDLVTMRPTRAYREFLVPGLAVYATPQNIAKFQSTEEKQNDQPEYSSLFAERTMNCLSRLVLQIIMNKSQPWTLEPWHVRASFRKAGYIVPEHAITMPPIQIQGPDLTLQDKEFYVTVTINKKEKVNVRCRIHHWAVGLERLPWCEYHWKKPAEPLIPEQAEVLAKIPLPQ